MIAVAARRYGTIVSHLTNDPTTAVELTAKLDTEVLNHLAAAIRDEIRQRAVDAGDQQSIINKAFDEAFGRDGMGCLPWIEGPFVVCPGSIVSKRRGSHTCRFASVNDTWIWDSHELIHEEKRSNPGADEGFRAVGLIAIVEGTEIDIVSGRARSGNHQIDRVVSYVISRGELVEVSQRDVAAARRHQSRSH